MRFAFRNQQRFWRSATTTRPTSHIGVNNKLPITKTSTFQWVSTTTAVNTKFFLRKAVWSNENSTWPLFIGQLIRVGGERHAGKMLRLKSTTALNFAQANKMATSGTQVGGFTVDRTARAAHNDTSVRPSWRGATVDDTIRRYRPRWAACRIITYSAFLPPHYYSEYPYSLIIDWLYMVGVISQVWLLWVAFSCADIIKPKIVFPFSCFWYGAVCQAISRDLLQVKIFEKHLAFYLYMKIIKKIYNFVSYYGLNLFYLFYYYFL
jgi:hypothetical protein